MLARYNSKTAMSAGETPLIRAARPTFSGRIRESFSAACALAADAVEDYILRGPQRAMEKYNRRGPR